MYVSTLDTPIGKISVCASDSAVTFIGFRDQEEDLPQNELSAMAREQLGEYFCGKRLTFEFPADQPGTGFQQKVWSELMQVEAGKPISYTALARRMGNLPAIRAIASANGRNNLMIVVPCHRIIGANGDLVGYAGGLWRKQWLLGHEAKLTGTGQTTLF
ncbi:MAG TPA: methylated-DNA--[protein]-cysteine S-methyltransferase [Sphingobacteriaceae bacterium]